jgi:ubiquinone/menaquinone biosynthesis C-methylase UbiE
MADVNGLNPGVRHGRHNWEDERVVYSFSHRSDTSSNRLRYLAEALDSMFRHLNITTLFDIGTGDGELLYLLLERNQSLNACGMDFSDALITMAKERLVPFAARCKLLRGDVFELPQGLPKGLLIPDGVLMARFLHHLDSTEAHRLLEHVATFCTNSAKVVIVERWAFRPRNKLQEVILRARKSISDAMFPGIGEFHHTFDAYMSMAVQAGFQPIRTDWVDRIVFVEDYARKLERLTGAVARADFEESVGRHSGELVLPTMIMTLEKAQACQGGHGV